MITCRKCSYCDNVWNSKEYISCPHCGASIDDSVVDPDFPQPPLSRLIKEGTVGTCPKCGSTEKRKYGFFGKVLGCINPRCENYWRTK